MTRCVVTWVCSDMGVSVVTWACSDTRSECSDKRPQNRTGNVVLGVLATVGPGHSNVAAGCFQLLHNPQWCGRVVKAGCQGQDRKKKNRPQHRQTSMCLDGPLPLNRICRSGAALRLVATAKPVFRSVQTA